MAVLVLKLLTLGILFSLHLGLKPIPSEGDPIDKERLLRMINSLRKRGCICYKRMRPAPPLKWSDTLEKVALLHSKDQAEHQKLSHRGSDGSYPVERAKRLNYKEIAVAENVAYNYPNVYRVMVGWRKSAGHCKNMMLPKATEIGVAKYGAYWTMVIGQSKASFFE